MSSGSRFASPSGTGPVALTRTPRGWAVSSAAGVETAGDLIEGLSLADLVAEEFGALTEPDRAARRSARGPGTTDAPLDSTEARIAELERTIAQLEHALASRVSTERAIGVLAERHSTSVREAFESLRRDARSQGRPVAELAREVLDSLTAESVAAPGAPAALGHAPGGHRPDAVVSPGPRPVARIPSGSPALTATDGAS
ncbi:ANTAR domain-containing protein [Blastococcus mobilis]|uniref:ANTAR domain-containing protein n=1 Tax=Blastococcus mobilis TaxID=1938746 RepID=UPI000B779DFA|nr:ANTAR domain-containing protein [Blastococcus mobilis]